ncbi:LCP family glycopolymer transferase [Lactobacillus acetotolerans]|jgi:LCP family protein required for cell wall assembly|uniref:Transcriptional regulator n=1 Tax=Lactobacillus acetotolerans TaxID=1600 RepID=A0A0D6A4R8_9LACO|nr:LCP family protein [Lactobacillus acetotolerans]QGV04060.1 LytR family transcriptional regulator [Lactobacillus acetotolerans]BAQ57817.1 transcriptional regulator [Lactobacillus acetotolerans]
MDPHSERREDYRARHSLNLHRNRAFAAPTAALKPGNKFARFVGVVMTLVVCFGLAWAAHMYFTVHSAIDGNSGSNSATSALIASKRPISVLILGVDQGIEGRHDQGNSDTLILATANPDKNTATMTSIPRDTLVNVLGDPGNKYFMYRVNSAYEVGGSKASVKTVSSLLNVPVNYYVEVNMKALRSLVSAVGGVDVDVPFDFSYDWATFHKGKQHLDGRHAVAYVRMRKEDPRGDYGRQMRQRQVIQAVAKKAMSVDTISNYRKLVKIFNKYIKTNLTFNDMFALTMNYRDCSKNLKSGYIQGHDAWINGASIQVAPTDELQKISDRVRTNLELNKETLNNEETRQNELNEKYNHIKWKDPDAFTNYQIYDQNSDTPTGGSGMGSGSSDTGTNSGSPNSSSNSKEKGWNIFK